jgi:hypothetical protein
MKDNGIEVWEIGRMILTEKIQSTRRKICFTATLSTTNPVRYGPGSKGGLRGGRPTTNHLSRSTARGAKDVATLKE